MDFIIDLPPSVKSGVKILLIITDRLNKGIILILILLIFTPAVAMAFYQMCHVGQGSEYHVTEHV